MSALVNLVRRQEIPVTLSQMVDLFAATFEETHRVRLVGGAREPDYIPAEAPADFHRIYFLGESVASALHEIAHWCIAGKARRALRDYGYWYEPDGRTASQQSEFEKVEVKPQALEWILSSAIRKPFFVSADNIGAQQGASVEFKKSIRNQALYYVRESMPPRARLFIERMQGFCDTHAEYRVYWEWIRTTHALPD